MTEPTKSIQAALIEGIHVKFYIPEGTRPFPVIILLHGWTGDEDSMWVFGSRMPSGCLLIAPRGLFPSSLGGFSWHQDGTRQWPEMDDFEDAFQVIHTIVHADIFADSADFTRLRLVGFSQGAALAYCFPIRSSFRLQAIAGLSGFVPDGVQLYIPEKPLYRTPVFSTHGTRDRIVPVERARNGVAILQDLGAEVTYCEDDAGHRLSAACFRGLEQFLSKN